VIIYESVNVVDDLEIVHVVAGGRITLPERIRKEWGLKDGDRIVLLKRDGRFYLRRGPP